MILIEGNGKIVIGEGVLSRLEQNVFQKKMNSPMEYRYESVDILLFELYMRTKIVESAKELSKAGVYFADFKKTKCNQTYWHVTSQGRLRLRNGVAPQNAIRDIFINGDSYAFECSMAVVVVLYKALLESIDPEIFDNIFADLLLFDWHSNIKLNLIDRTNNEEAVMGDVLYFENPDVEPLLPWWKGENVVVVENDHYYGHGHGLGIASGEEIINFLNKYRRFGSTKSAFLSHVMFIRIFPVSQIFSITYKKSPLLRK